MRSRLAFLLSILAVAMAACNPPLAATPTAAPPAAAPTVAPAPKPTTAPAAAATTAPAPTTAPAAAAKPADPLQAVVDKYYEAAKKEGKRVLYVLGNTTLYNPGRDGFQKR